MMNKNQRFIYLLRIPIFLAALIFCVGSLLLFTWADPITLQATDLHWTIDQSPVLVDTVLTIDGTLTIDPGVAVHFNPNAGLNILGTLEAKGTQVLPITFSGTTESKGSWYGVNVTQTATVNLEHLTLSHAGKSASNWYGSIVKHPGGSLTLKHVTITNGHQHGVYARGTGVFEMSDSVISDVNGSGLYVYGNASYVENTAISLCGDNGIYVKDTDDFSSGILPQFKNITVSLTSDHNVFLEANVVATAFDPSCTFDGVIRTEGVVSRDQSISANHPLSVRYINVSEGALLTIDAGAVLNMDASGSLGVYGTLDINGTASNPVTMSNSSGNKGAWHGILTLSTGVSTIDYLDISEAGKGSTLWYGSIGKQDGGHLALNHVTITNGSQSGVDVRGSGTFTMDDCVITDVATNGLYVYGNTALVNNTQISLTGHQGIYVKDSPQYTDANLPQFNNVSVSHTTSYNVFLEPNVISTYFSETCTFDGVIRTEGTLSKDQTISSIHPITVYYISISNGTTLTIDSGAVLDMLASGSFSVYGNLDINGTALNPVTMSSSTGNKGAWHGILTTPTGVSTIDYLHISEAGKGATHWYGSIGKQDGGHLTLNHVTITNGLQSGVDVRGSGTFTMDDCVISDIDRRGLYVYGSSALVNNTDISLIGDQGIAVIDSTHYTGANLPRFDNVSVSLTGSYNVYLDPNVISTYFSSSCSFDGIIYTTGTLSKDQTLPSLYPMTIGTFVVSKDVTLTVEAGADLVMVEAGQFNVSGTMSVDGTEALPVHMSTLSGVRGSWYGIFVTPTGHVDYAYTSISGAGKSAGGWYGSVTKQSGGHLNFDHVSITNGLYAGIYLEDDGVAIIENSLIDGHRQYGIRINGSSAQVTNTVIKNCEESGILIWHTARFETNPYPTFVDVTSIDNPHSVKIHSNVSETIFDPSCVFDTPIYVSGGLDYTQTLNNNHPYYMEGLTINSPGKLILLEGTDIYFSHGGYLNVLGELVSLGTAQDPVTLTSKTPDGSQPWLGLYANASGTVDLLYTDISHAGKYQAGWYGSITKINGGQLTLKQVTLKNGLRTGIHAIGDGLVSLNQVLITDNEGYGLVIEGSPALVEDTTISNCGKTGVYVKDSIYYTTNPYPVFRGITLLNNTPYGMQLDADVLSTSIDDSSVMDTPIYVHGNLTRSHVMAANHPYQVKSIYITETGSLDIKPGMNLHFLPDGYLFDRGTLHVGQDDQAQVTLTAANDLTAPGSWLGLMFAEDARVSLAVTLIEYAGKTGSGWLGSLTHLGSQGLHLDHVVIKDGLGSAITLDQGTDHVFDHVSLYNHPTGLTINQANFVMTNSNIKNNTTGLFFAHSLANGTLKSSDVKNNTKGIKSYSGLPLTIGDDDTSYVLFSGNTLAISNESQSGTIINARRNHWGDLTGPTHASNPDGLGDPISNMVDYGDFIGSDLIINHPPTDISLSDNQFDENLPVNTLVGSLSTTDQDTGDTFTYNLVNGEGDASNAYFNIVGDQLFTALVFDYEAQSSYTVRISSTDQDGLSFEKAFALEVVDVNEAPTGIDMYRTVMPDTLVTEQVTGFDPDQDPLRFILEDTTTKGVLDFKEDGSFTYITSEQGGGSDFFTYHVTDGQLDSPTYTVAFGLNASQEALLTRLEVVGFSLTPTFDENTLTYSLSVANTTSSVTLEAAAKNATMGLKLNDQAPVLASLSEVIPVNVGTNTLTVQVIAADLTTTVSYQVLITRAQAPITPPETTPPPATTPPVEEVVEVIEELETPLGFVPFSGAYVSGYSGQYFRPDEAITRAEVATIMMRLMGSPMDQDQPVSFKDLPQSHWSFKAVQAAIRNKLFKGYTTGVFKPDQAISRAEIAMVLNNFWAFYDLKQTNAKVVIPDVSETHWAKDAISRLYYYGIVKGYEDQSFKPNQQATRAEFVVMVNRILDRHAIKKTTASFKDVPLSHWAFGNIEAAVSDLVTE